MKNTMKRTLGLFAAALLTMTLALGAYASGHDLTFTDKGNRMHVKDKTVHVQTYYPYEYYVLDVLEDALVVANPEWDDCGFAVCRRVTDDYTYLYAFGTIADEADDMQDVFYNICDQLELVD